jgi:sortase A
VYDTKVKLRRLNTALLIAIIIVNGYIIALPLLPGLLFRLERDHTSQTAKLKHTVDSVAAPAQIPQDDRLVIPGMLLDEPVYTGQTIKTLHKGLWLRPTGSTPERGGNTIIVGHRFTYTNPRGSLYHLDKVSIGDHIGMFWQGKQYRYVVRTIKTVKATEIAVEAPTTRSQLTIYTCTPLWLPKDRLVVIAEELQ